jgi:hypothetical protein
MFDGVDIIVIRNLGLRTRSRALAAGARTPPRVDAAKYQTGARERRL